MRHPYGAMSSEMEAVAFLRLYPTPRGGAAVKVDQVKRLPVRVPFSLRFAPSERKVLEAAAEQRQLRLGDFVRRAALQSARQTLAEEGA
jgi:hypothetical protein